MTGESAEVRNPQVEPAPPTFSIGPNDTITLNVVEPSVEGAWSFAMYYTQTAGQYVPEKVSLLRKLRYWWSDHRPYIHLGPCRSYDDD